MLLNPLHTHCSHNSAGELLLELPAVSAAEQHVPAPALRLVVAVDVAAVES